jgi:hypothetical protein
MNTLIVDAEGICDPHQLNDRLLGLKGTMSEAELGWPRQGAMKGCWPIGAPGRTGAAAAGRLRARAHGRVEKNPDQRVQQAIVLVFERFAALGSARQVLLWCRQEGMALPVVPPSVGARGPVT